MGLREIVLTGKKQLTHDVLELHYDFGENITMLPGQFVTFILPEIGGRSYSVLDIDGNTIKLIIKRRDKENGGRGGSIILCDSKVGDTFKVVGPAGHFTLSENIENKLFLGTGTGIVPLHNQILAGLKESNGKKYKLIFGVRNTEDLFYLDELESLKQQYPDTFSYHIMTSRSPENGIIKKGYVTDVLSTEIINNYKEFYLCGAPAMIESCQEKLKDLGVSDTYIYFEKYA